MNPPTQSNATDRQWEFDSHLDVCSQLGGLRIMQVWSRPSPTWHDAQEWTLTEDTPGRENPPQPRAGHYTSIEAFRKAHPNFNR